MSEQEALECSDGRGCDGGWDHLVYQYTQKANGATGAAYAYKEKMVNKCEDSANRPRVNGTKVEGWKSLPNDAETIRFYLYNNGPM